jgi:hypothetical protein
MTKILRLLTKKSQSIEELPSKIDAVKKTKATKIICEKVAEDNSENNRLNRILSIDSILISIFSYLNFSDLVNFNTVCKRWNQLANPVIYRCIKLQRRKTAAGEVNGRKFHEAAGTDIEIAECIDNNEKYAHFVKEFRFQDILRPQKAVKLFQTFKYIARLTLERVGMSQDLFLNAIIPLSQLKELNL